MPVGIKRKVRSEKVFVLESETYKCHDPPNPWVTTCNCNVKGSSLWMVFTHPFFSALCYCCHLVPFVNSKFLATTPILERGSYGKGSECLRVNCKHPLKEDSDVLVGRANKLRWTKVYKGSELRGDWGGWNEKLAASPLSSKPDKTVMLRKLPGKESIPHFGKVIWREMKAATASFFYTVLSLSVIFDTFSGTRHLRTGVRIEMATPLLWGLFWLDTWNH